MEFSGQSLANTAWAFAKAGHFSPAMFEAIAAVAVPRLDEFKQQELANLAWAFATADVESAVLFGDKSQFVRVCAERTRWSEEQLAQLRCWQEWCRWHHEKEDVKWPLLPPAMFARKSTLREAE